MKKLILGLTLTVLVGGMSAHAARAKPDGAFDIMPGKNRVEWEINWAWKMLPEFLKACSLSPDCKLSPEQQQLVRTVSLQSFSKEQIVFISEKSNPQMFQTSTETHRLAVTAGSVGSPIYINSDRYQKNGKSFGIPFWMGVLTHELMHHQGIPDDARRIPDTLGSLIANAAQALLVETQIPENTQGITTFILNPPRPQSTEIFNYFPDGVWFYVLKMDSDLAVEDVGTVTANALSPICPEGLQSAYVGVSPEGTTLSEVGNAYRATMSLYSTAFCFDKSNWKAEAVKGGYNNIFDIKKENGVFKLDVQGNTNWGVSAANNGQAAFRTGTMIDLQIPKSVNAGDELVIEAKVSAPEGLNYIGCGAFLGGWSVANIVSSMTVVPDSCELKKTGDNLYTLSLRKRILPSTPAQDLEIANLCLMIPKVSQDDGDCIPVYPVKKTWVKILNSKPLKQMAITDLQLKGNHLRFVIRNAMGLEYLYLCAVVQDADGNAYGANISVTNGAFPEAYESLKVTQVGSDIVVEAVLKLITMSGIQMVQEEIENITVVTKDLRYQVLDVTNQKLRVQP